MSILRSSAFFSAGTILSRISGLVRDRVVYATFGASVYLDAFYVAFRLPNMARELLGEGALGSAFTKSFSALWERDQEKAKKLLSDTLLLFALISFVVCSLGIVLAPWLVRMMTAMAGTSDSAGELVANATGLTRIMFPFLGLMVLNAVVMGALHQSGRFFVTAVAPVFFNVGLITGAIVFSEQLQSVTPRFLQDWGTNPAIAGLAGGVLLGGLLQLSLNLWGLWRPILTTVPRPNFKAWQLSDDIKKLLFLMGPMVLAASASQINLLTNTIFATSLEAGTVSLLNAAYRILHFPVGTFGIAVGIAALPTVTKALTRHQEAMKEQGKTGPVVDDVSSNHINGAFELVLWLMIPCFVFLQLMANDAISLIYQAGKFTEDSVMTSAATLRVYALSLLAYGLIKLLIAIYFALDRVKYAMRVAFVCVLVNLIAHYFLVDLFKIYGLAGAFALTLNTQVLLLIWGLRGQGIRWQRGRLGKSLSMILITAALAVGLWLLVDSLWPKELTDALPITLQAFIRLAAGAAVVFGLFLGAGVIRSGQSPKQLLASLKRK